MEFNPEDAGHGILKDGEYNFEVVTAEDTISKFNDGEEQIQLNLRIFHDGGVIFLNQWLSPSKTWKIKQFSQSVGLVKEFEAGKLTAVHCEDKSGLLKIGNYEDKSGTVRNSVFKYLESETTEGEVKEALKTFKATATDESHLPSSEDMPF